MGGKKKKSGGGGKKKKSAKANVEFLDYNIQVIISIIVGNQFQDFVQNQMDKNGWIKFELVNWKFGNYTLYLKARDHVFKLFDSVMQKHGKVDNIILYKQDPQSPDAACFHNPTIPIYRAYHTFGGATREQAPIFHVWYDFMPHNSSDPILLATSGIPDKLSLMLAN